MKCAKRALALLALLPLPVFAAPYIVIGGATGHIDLSDIKYGYRVVQPVHTDDRFTRAIVGAGDQINANWGVEASYLSGTSNSVKSNNGFADKISARGLQAAVLGYLPAVLHVRFFGKASANVMSTRYDTNLYDETGPYTQKTRKLDPGWGAGAEFTLTGTMSLRATVEEIRMRDVANSDLLHDAGNFNVTQGELALMMFF